MILIPLIMLAALFFVAAWNPRFDHWVMPALAVAWLAVMAAVVASTFMIED
jgi:hypothetical protein